MRETENRMKDTSKKKVVVLVKAELLVEVREDFDVGDIEFYYNESSACASNWIEDLSRQEERLTEAGMCSCNHVEVLYQRYPTEEDLDNFAAREGL